MTWPERFIVITVKDDFERLMGCCYRNYLAHPDAWTNLFKISGDDMQGRWRAVFPSGVDETDEEALSDAAVTRRLAHVFPRTEPTRCCTVASTASTSGWRRASGRAGCSWLATPRTSTTPSAAWG